MPPEINKALSALKFIIPILEKYNFRWVITGGFAAHVFGVKRPITDIDIDIDTTKDSDDFKKFLNELTPHITQPLEHFVDQNYDNYNFEIAVSGQVIDICPMKELCIYNQTALKYELFYNHGFPAHEIVKWNGLSLPLLAKELIVKNKEMLVWQRESDFKDIQELRNQLR